MTNQSPVTPPPELVQQWVNQFAGEQACMPEQVYIAMAAAQWGADQELEACCEWIADWYGNGYNEVIGHLRSARRPKPPSLKEQALEALDSCSCDEADSWKLIRRALEQLDD